VEHRRVVLLKYVMLGIGGVMGTIARYALGSFIASRYGIRYPFGTFIINVSGSFLIGLILTLLTRTNQISNFQYMFAIGFIGAYTTFATFEYETFRAFQDRHMITGLLNVVLSVVVGFTAVWAGAAIGRNVRVPLQMLSLRSGHCVSAHLPEEASTEVTEEGTQVPSLPQTRFLAWPKTDAKADKIIAAGIAARLLD
jgi:CrcB protein